MVNPIPEDIGKYYAYDPETGDITRIAKLSPFARGPVGVVVGTLARGYLRILFRGRCLSCHRIAWFLMTGEHPPSIDHRDLNRANNRWENLRAATMSQNSANVPGRRSGLKGVTALPNGRYQAQLKTAGTNYYLGSFDTEQEAHAAYLAKSAELFGEFARAA